MVYELREEDLMKSEEEIGECIDEMEEKLITNEEELERYINEVLRSITRRG